MIRIGSRGSALARWQAGHIADALRALGHSVEIEILVTTGDRMEQTPFAAVGTKGMFTKEIEEALAGGRIDLAVHSLKDLPTELAPEFVIAAIPERADARDAFVSARWQSLAELPAGARVGTSSLRRQAQLRALRPDVAIEELRGNVDTRLRKLNQGGYDAIVLAAAGLDRLGLDAAVRARFSPEEMCPAAGQGALAVECRAEDLATREMLAALDHAPTRFAVTAERTALGALEGGCQVPIGVHCSGGSLVGVVARPDGSKILRERVQLPAEEWTRANAETAGRELAERLLAQGAGEMLGQVHKLLLPLKPERGA